MNTKIVETSEDQVISYDVFDKLANNRILFLHDFIDDKMAADITAALLFLDLVEESKITFYLNAEGGDIRSVFMIYDFMGLIVSPIEVICTGSAIHEPILILAAGTKGLRKATKNSILCVNQLSALEASYSDLTNAKILHEQIKKENKKYIETLAKCINKPYKNIVHLFDRQLFLTPQEAKKLGLIDVIIGENTKKPQSRRKSK